MILTVGSIKGGVGKTTLAVNLAIYAGKTLRRHVALVDADDQATAVQFTEIREQEGQGPATYACVSIRGAQVRSQRKSLAGRFDTTVIDCGGRNTEAFRAALTLYDTLIAPMAPRSFDFWSVTWLAELLDEVNAIRDQPVTAYAVVNLADSSGTDNRDALVALAEFPQLQVLDTVLVRRKAWPNSSSHGQAIFESSPRDKKAVAEFQAFVDMIF